MNPILYFKRFKHSYGVPTEYLYGKSSVIAALKHGRRRHSKLMLALDAKIDDSLITLAKEKDIPIERVSRKLLDDKTKDGVHQGVVLKSTQRDTTKVKKLGMYTPDENGSPDVFKYAIYDSDKVSIDKEFKPTHRPFPLWIGLDRIMDPRNLGAILRSCSFFKVDGIVLTLKNSAPITPDVCKASCGALETMEVYGVTSLGKFLDASAINGWKVYGTDINKNGLSAKEIPPMNAPTILVFGNEGCGVSPTISQQCHAHIHIGTVSRDDLDSLSNLL